MPSNGTSTFAQGICYVTTALHTKYLVGKVFFPKIRQTGVKIADPQHILSYIQSMQPWPNCPIMKKIISLCIHSVGGGALNKYSPHKPKDLRAPTLYIFVLVYQTCKMVQAYLSSLPILAVVYRFFYLPTANLPIYHNLPISTDFFADLPNFNFFSTDLFVISCKLCSHKCYFHVLMVKSASPL